MKIYLAANWSLKDEMRQARSFLHQAGHQVTSRWLDFPAQQSLNAPDLADDPEIGVAYASKDLEDIDAAECVLVFTEVASTTGGLHVELGYALGRGKRVLVCGPRVNVFQCVVEQYPNLAQAAAFLASLPVERTGQATGSLAEDAEEVSCLCWRGGCPVHG